MPARTLHDVPRDAYSYVWDHEIPPALEVAAGDEVRLALRDASDEQIHEDSDASAIAQLDFDHVNPVSGPIFVKNARPGDVLAVEILEFSAPTWGWTAIIPGFGLLADEFPDPWLRISRIDAEARRVRFSDGISLPLAPFTGTIGVAPAEAGQHRCCRRRAAAATSTPATWCPAPRSSCPCGSRAPCSRPGTPTPPRATARSAAPPSRADGRHRPGLGAARPTARRPRPRDPRPDRARAIERGGWDVLTGVGPDLMEASRDAVGRRSRSSSSAAA